MQHDVYIKAVGGDDPIAPRQMHQLKITMSLRRWLASPVQGEVAADLNVILTK